MYAVAPLISGSVPPSLAFFVEVDEAPPRALIEVYIPSK